MHQGSIIHSSAVGGLQVHANTSSLSRPPLMQTLGIELKSS